MSTKTLDHSPNHNHWFQCVECSVLSTILYFHPEYVGKLDADQIQDMVLGPNWQGGSDAIDFIGVAAKHGVKLFSVNGLNPAQQIMAAHRFIQEGKPVIFTLKDGYVDTRLPQFENWTHACTWHAEVPGGLTALDSLGDGTHTIGGRNVTRTDSEWMADLRGSVLWVAENSVAPTQLVSAIKIPTGWKDDTVTLTSPGGYQAQHGFRDFILSHSWNPTNALESTEYTAMNGNRRQDCLSCALIYNPKEGVTLIEGEMYLQLLWADINHYNALASHDKSVMTSLRDQLTQEQQRTQTAQNALLEVQKGIAILATQHETDKAALLTLHEVNIQLQDEVTALKTPGVSSNGTSDSDALLLHDLEALVSKYHPL